MAKRNGRLPVLPSQAWVVIVVPYFFHPEQSPVDSLLALSYPGVRKNVMDGH